MAQFVVRDLEEEVKVRLKRLAERHGRSMEEEIRHILRNAAKESGRPVTKLGSRISGRFSSTGLTTDLSELRGHEVWPYLRAANSGHPGSLSTVHADSPEGAITQLVFMMQQAGSTSSEEQISNYIKSIIDVVIQLKRDPDPERFMHVSEVWYGK